MRPHYWPFIVYLILQGVWFGLVPQQSHLFADSGGYYQFLHTLGESTETSFGLRMPVYPILLWAGSVLPGNDAAWVVAWQAVFLWLTAIMAAALGYRLLDAPRLLTLCIVAFNPYSLAMSQAILPDTLFAFLFMTMVYSACRLYCSGELKWAAGMGAAMGLMALTRGNGALLAAVFGCIFLSWLWFRQSQSLRWRSSAAIAVSGFALLLIAWGVYNSLSTGQFRILSPVYKAYAVNDNLAAAVVLSQPLEYRKDRSFEDARKHVRQLAIDKAGLDLTPEPTAMSSQNALVEAHSWYVLSQMSVSGFATAVAVASIRFYIDPGLGEISQMLARQAGGVWTSLLKYSLWCWSLLTRLLFLLAICLLLRKWRLEALIFMLIPIVLVWGSAAFIGYARYRLPAEPFILSLAVVGLMYLRKSLLTETKSKRTL